MIDYEIEGWKIKKIWRKKDKKKENKSYIQNDWK